MTDFIGVGPDGLVPVNPDAFGNQMEHDKRAHAAAREAYMKELYEAGMPQPGAGDGDGGDSGGDSDDKREVANGKDADDEKPEEPEPAPDDGLHPGVSVYVYHTYDGANPDKECVGFIVDSGDCYLTKEFLDACTKNDQLPVVVIYDKEKIFRAGRLYRVGRCFLKPT